MILVRLLLVDSRRANNYLLVEITVYNTAELYVCLVVLSGLLALGR
jgi:hypothetical protein